MEYPLSDEAVMLRPSFAIKQDTRNRLSKACDLNCFPVPTGDCSKGFTENKGRGNKWSNSREIIASHSHVFMPIVATHPPLIEPLRRSTKSQDSAATFV
jgi:hypothetical protein